jgi:hypothetical protein
MAKIAAFEAVDALLCRLTGIELPFSGKVIIAIGDFCQVAPIIKGGGPTTCYRPPSSPLHSGNTSVSINLQHQCIMHQIPLPLCSIMHNLSLAKGLVKNQHVVIIGMKAQYIEVKLLHCGH